MTFLQQRFKVIRGKAQQRLQARVLEERAAMDAEVAAKLARGSPQAHGPRRRSLAADAACSVCSSSLPAVFCSECEMGLCASCDAEVHVLMPEHSRTTQVSPRA